MHVALRLDASAAIGLGHLTRSLALLEVLQTPVPAPAAVRHRQRAAIPEPTSETGRKKNPAILHATLITRSSGLASLIGDQWPIAELPESVPDAEEGRWIAENFPQTELLIADLYRPSLPLLRSLRQGKWLLVCLDDETRSRIECDLLINPNLSPAFLHRLAPNTPYLHGAQSVILRPQFANARRRECRDRCAHLALAFGGSDPDGLTLKTVQALRQTMPSGIRQISVVVGSGYGDIEALQTLFEGDVRWQLRRNVIDMRSLLEAADVGVLAAGTLLYEAAVTGLPTLSYGVNAAQEREAEFAALHRATHYMGRSENFSAAELHLALREMLDFVARQEMARQAQELLDGEGARCVAHDILMLLEARRQRPCAA